VGTHANVPPAIEEYVCDALGLRPEEAATQVVQRDRHAEFLLTLALIASSLEKMATEIRGLQRTEVGEVAEPFSAGQQGSSAMPHKRNPELAERVCGLARIVRAAALPALENVVLWHERDISHSSTERVIFPDACLALDYALAEMTAIIDGLVVFPEAMMYNLEASGGLTFSQQILLKLVEKGLDRQVAYKLVQKHAMKERSSFIDGLKSDPEINTRFSNEELEGVFDYAYHLKHIDTAFQRLGLGSTR
jgi:adenylosuccinate lyase